MPMKITILFDNHPGSPLAKPSHGFSALVEFSGGTFLFDTGSSKLVVENAEALGADLGSASHVVLSHGHWDHCNGLKYVAQKNPRLEVIAHPDVQFGKWSDKGDGEEYKGIGKSSLEKIGELRAILSEAPLEFLPNAFFLGEVDRVTDFEAQETLWYTKTSEGKKNDYMLDDTGVAVKTGNGLVVLTGCAHSGVVNIVKHAQKVCGENRVRAVIGGFHLGSASDGHIRKVIMFFRKAGVQELFPCHCTGDAAISMMVKELGAKKVGAGSVIEIEE